MRLLTGKQLLEGGQFGNLPLAGADPLTSALYTALWAPDAKPTPFGDAAF